jgi:hypothetical protein
MNEFINKYPWYQTISNGLGLLFFTALCLTVWEINIYRKTFISVRVPFVIWILPGIILYPFLIRVLDIYIFNRNAPGHLPIFWHFFYNIITWGGLSVFIFMWANYNFTNRQPQDILTKINSSGHLAEGTGGCGEPYIYITYKEQEKQLVFPCGTPIEGYSSVHLKIEKGLFGYEVIKDQSLKDEHW